MHCCLLLVISPKRAGAYRQRFPEAAPPAGLQVLSLSLEFPDVQHLEGVLHGATWCFRDRLESAGVFGVHDEESPPST